MSSTLELVLAARSGDREAFEVLVRGESPQAYRLAMVICGHSSDAEDALQEAWIKVWSSLPSLREPEHWSSWFHRIVANAAIDRGRRTRRAKDIARIQRVLKPEPAPDAMAEEEDTIARAMSRLKPDERALLSLRYLLDMEVRDVALVLDVPEGTVKSRLHRLLQRLEVGFGSDNEVGR